MKYEFDRLSLKYDHPFVISNKKYGGSFDFAFPEIKLAVECDGIYNHSRPKDILRDIRKAQFCADNDWRLLRFTDQQIKKDLPSCIHTIMFYYYVRSHNSKLYEVNGSKDLECQQSVI
jgi:very-short-patch-repair endonuclease